MPVDQFVASFERNYKLFHLFSLVEHRYQVQQRDQEL